MITKNLINKVKNVINYIEENIKENITLDRLSRYANLSKYHLHRIFKSLTNKNLISYIRERKLAKSINELLNTSLNIIDIAYEYGFKYEQSYIRAFKNTFGISPKKLRIKKTPLKITKRIDINQLVSLGQNGYYYPTGYYDNTEIFGC